MANIYHRHFVGYILIALSGTLLLAGLIIGIFAAYHAGSLTATLYNLLATLIVAVILGTMLSLWFWRWPVLILGTSSIVVTNWTSFFSSVQAEAEWIEIEDVTVARSGILAQLFGYGRIEVETAGTRPNITFSYLPNAQSVADSILNTVETLKAERKAAE